MGVTKGQRRRNPEGNTTPTPLGRVSRDLILELEGQTNETHPSRPTSLTGVGVGCKVQVDEFGRFYKTRKPPGGDVRGFNRSYCLSVYLVNTNRMKKTFQEISDNFY